MTSTCSRSRLFWESIFMEQKYKAWIIKTETFETSCFIKHFTHDGCTQPLKRVFWSAHSSGQDPVGIRSRASPQITPWLGTGVGGSDTSVLKGTSDTNPKACFARSWAHSLPPLAPLQAWKQACLRFCEAEPISGRANSISRETQMVTSFLFSWPEGLPWRAS